MHGLYAEKPTNDSIREMVKGTNYNTPCPIEMLTEAFDQEIKEIKSGWRCLSPEAFGAKPRDVNLWQYFVKVTKNDTMHQNFIKEFINGYTENQFS